MFVEAHARRFEAISAVIDLEGFSPFSTQPDNHRQFPRFLNFVFERVNDSLSAAGLAETRTYFKFLGDGGLYIWPITEADSRAMGRSVVLALHNLYRVYPVEVLDNADDLNVRAVPKRIRVGIAQGEITELQTETGYEYVGFSINLAARLQRFCPAIGFLVSCSVALDEGLLEDYSLVRARTKQIRGMPGLEEDVRFIKEDASGLRKRALRRWFQLEP